MKIKFKGENPFAPTPTPKIGDKYSFTSYDGTGEVEHATGTVEVTNITASYYTLKVLTNVPIDENAADFVNQSFKVKVEDINKSRIPLYASNGAAIDLTVSISPLVEEEQQEQSEVQEG